MTKRILPLLVAFWPTSKLSKMTSEITVIKLILIRKHNLNLIFLPLLTLIAFVCMPPKYNSKLNSSLNMPNLPPKATLNKVLPLLFKTLAVSMAHMSDSS